MPEDFSRWLDCLNQEPRHVADLMRPAPDGFSRRSGFRSGQQGCQFRAGGAEACVDAEPAEPPAKPAKGR
jgi:hypothetical protein